MNFGVIITRGACPWQIFPQGPDGTAPIHLEGTYHLIHLSQELPLSFSQAGPARATVRARVALESTGESVIPWTECDIPEEGRWQITFPAVPAGGLYRIETGMDYEGWDGLSCTRGDMVHHVGVGDVFVIAGQSNAAGRAKDPVADEPELGVHVVGALAHIGLILHSYHGVLPVGNGDHHFIFHRNPSQMSLLWLPYRHNNPTLTLIITHPSLFEKQIIHEFFSF